MKSGNIQAKTKYAVIGLLILFPLLGLGYLVADSVVTISHKMQLANTGSQIVATITDRDSSFSPVRGGGFTTYNIDYEFEYNDQAGTLSKQTQTDFEVTKSQYREYKVGSQIIITYLASDPRINEPAASIEKMNPAFILIMKFLFGFTISIIAVSVFRKVFPSIAKKRDDITIAIAIGLLFVSFLLGALLGQLVVQALEASLF